jgi:dipeptidyl aminopeptidase/acylaminoacyl peptidase
MCKYSTPRKARLLALCVAGVLAGSASAQIADPAKLFAKEAEYQGARLSPTGDYVAVTTPFENRRALSLIHLSGDYARSLIKFDVGPDRWGRIVRQEPFGPVWSDDTRLIVNKAVDYGIFGGKSGTGDVYASNADGSAQVQLFGYLPDRGNIRSRFKDEGSPYLIKVLPDSGGTALFGFQPWPTGNSQRTTAIYRVNTHKGTRQQVESFSDAYGVSADNTGALRVATRRTLEGNQVVQYKPTPDAAWQPMPASLAGTYIGMWVFDADNNRAYAEISDKGEPASLYRVDFAAGIREKLASHPTLEISDFQRAGRLGPPVAIAYTGGRPKVDYLDTSSPWAQLHSGLMKAFPGHLIDFVDITKDEKKLLFYAYSDREPGAYYLFDRTTNKPSLLFRTHEWIDPAQMSPMQALEFKNRGGETIYAFLTTPRGKAGPHPLVVMPHGGPYGVSDAWGYDSHVQFLASLGYAVLQVNYRGSGGRGDAFERATYKQWGTGIQDDIADGVKHAIAQNLVDPKKVCIYGISFGGYSAMMNPIRNPGMYRCAIGYAGVYDLVQSSEEDDSSKQLRAFFARTMGDVATQREQSPVQKVAQLDVPMLLIHGKSDYVAPFEQFRLAESALSRAGKTYETLAKADEGHGFYKEPNRVEAFERIQAFLLKYNPPN